MEVGGPDRDRTCDLKHAMLPLSQLSYRPTFTNLQIDKSSKILLRIISSSSGQWWQAIILLKNSIVRGSNRT